MGDRRKKFSMEYFKCTTSNQWGTILYKILYRDENIYTKLNTTANSTSIQTCTIDYIYTIYVYTMYICTTRHCEIYPDKNTNHESAVTVIGPLLLRALNLLCHCGRLLWPQATQHAKETLVGMVNAATRAFSSTLHQ